jgi:sugar lactone lactonase YvrE
VSRAIHPRLNRPNDVVVAPNGDIFVVDSHGPDQVRTGSSVSAPDGTHMATIGGLGYGPGQFLEPHAIAMDSQGRLFVADRYNNRIQILDQDGEFMAAWTQFGRPSGIFIDENDLIYVADSESGPAPNALHRAAERRLGAGHPDRGRPHRVGLPLHPRNLEQPQPERHELQRARGVAVDAEGNVYGAESPSAGW